MMKKKLSLRETLEVCFILFEKNTEEQALRMFQKNVLPEQTPFEEFLPEWQAFVFAAVYYGLAKYAPAFIVLEYVRSIKYMLKNLGGDEEKINAFLDGSFQVYMRLIIEEREKACPETFYRRMLSKPLTEVDKKQAVVLSGAMAMLLANCADIFENYDYALS